MQYYIMYMCLLFAFLNTNEWTSTDIVSLDQEHSMIRMYHYGNYNSVFSRVVCCMTKGAQIFYRSRYLATSKLFCVAFCMVPGYNNCLHKFLHIRQSNVGNFHILIILTQSMQESKSLCDRSSTKRPVMVTWSCLQLTSEICVMSACYLILNLFSLCSLIYEGVF